MLWACLLLPSLPLDVFARAQEPAARARPFAVATGGHYPRIVITNAAAREAGIRAQQLVSASLALAPGLLLRDRDLGAESAALEAVATWATQFTPAVSLAPPDAVLAEVGGSLRLFGGRRRLAAQFVDGMRELGYAARLSLAPTPTAALLLARTGEGGSRRIGAPAPRQRSDLEASDAEGSDSAALASIPLALAEADPHVVALLASAGITTFGQACSLPRDALARRAGGEFVAMLDRARGLAPDPRPPYAPPPRYAGTLPLPSPLSNLEALAFAVHRLVHELAGWLRGRGLGAVAMSLALAHERYVGAKTGVPATAVRFALAAPARETGHLMAVLRERLARVDLPAPVEAITLATESVAPLSSRNLGLLPDDDVVATVPLLDRLRARLGENAVTRVVPHPEHRPERAWQPALRNARSANATGPIVSAFAPRPLWLLAEPEPLGHLLATQPWVLRDGPERIESGWWDGMDVRRDYFVAENPRGETLWIYRDHRYGIDDGEWFVHGVFA